MKKITRRSTAFVDLVFIDEDLDLVIPTAATAKIHDRETETVIRAATALAGLASSMTIVIDEDENEIITPTTELEVHVLTVEFDYLSAYGTAHRSGELEFMIENLQGVEVPAGP